MEAAPGAYGKRKQTGDRTQGFLLFISGDRYCVTCMSEL
ncbi:hypothetical protein SAMN05446935_0109 [Burkholderia sp. YR290]|nr:hypothetical protein PMI06_003648 [Burkholderia sp. BT03]SEI10874.1 hypothetical protein SAMN05192544_1021121 [Paraburkholderia hospita]SKC75444.1 hypothetical protein SAMN05445504_1901 [Burkholderia sp. CF099]SOE46639.1 hypothetical protein SAMN05446935_0109 [Burkholderia sp. YR290]SKC73312.1 hypothetical protein SAMN05446934_2646 [Paraburkholderia hospita]